VTSSLLRPQSEHLPFADSSCVTRPMVATSAPVNGGWWIGTVLEQIRHRTLRVRPRCVTRVDPTRTYWAPPRVVGSGRPADPELCSRWASSVRSALLRVMRELSSSEFEERCSLGGAAPRIAGVGAEA
jgi:hypothetical protein